MKGDEIIIFKDRLYGNKASQISKQNWKIYNYEICNLNAYDLPYFEVKRTIYSILLGSENVRKVLRHDEGSYKPGKQEKQSIKDFRSVKGQVKGPTQFCCIYFEGPPRSEFPGQNGSPAWAAGSLCELPHA